jgi:hypothetical protein
MGILLRFREQGFEEFVAHHAVADDDQFHVATPKLQ